MHDAILVATDGNTRTVAVARYGSNLAAVFESRIPLPCAVDERSYSSALADLAPMLRDRQEVFEQRATRAVERLEELAGAGSRVPSVPATHAFGGRQQRSRLEIEEQSNRKPSRGTLLSCPAHSGCPLISVTGTVDRRDTVSATLPSMIRAGRDRP